MTNRKRVYLAGPMRNYPGFNFPMFDRVKAAFGAGVWEVISPADMDREIGFDGTTDEGLDEEFVQDAMRRDINEVLTCHAICLLPGWEASAGAQCEYSVASALGLEILMYVEGEGVKPFTSTALPKATLYSYGDLTPSPKTAEVRVTSATGGEKGMKQAQLGALDPKALMAVAEVAGFGSQKYARYNFLKGYDWSLSYDAMQRHLHTFWSGTDNDDESNLPHLAHACWHTLALLAFSQRKIGTDDRP